MDSSIINFLRKIEAEEKLLGSGRQADAYKMPVPFSSYVLRVRYDEGPSLQTLKASTALSLYPNLFKGRNFGQPIIGAEGVTINVFTGNSLGQIYREKIEVFEKEQKIDQYLVTRIYNEMLDELIAKDDNFFEDLMRDLGFLTSKGIGIDNHGDNLVIKPSGRGGFIDTDFNESRNTIASVLDLLKDFYKERKPYPFISQDKLSVLEQRLNKANEKIKSTDSLLVRDVSHRSLRPEPIGLTFESSVEEVSSYLDRVRKDYNIQEMTGR